MVDTAASYAQGRAEAMLGSMLGDVVARSEMVISTKAGVSSSDSRRSVNASRGAMLSALDASLARLGTDYIDIWFAHEWDPNVPLDETLSALELAQRSGRARYVGISNYNGWQTAKAAAVAGFTLVANQSEYSLVQRKAEEELIPAVEDAGLGLMAWAPLGRGVLSGKYRGQIPADSRAAQSRLAGLRRAVSRVAGLQGSGSGGDGSPRTGQDPHGRFPELAALPARRCDGHRGPRNAVQLKELMDAQLTVLPAEIARALEDVSAV